MTADVLANNALKNGCTKGWRESQKKNAQRRLLPTETRLSVTLMKMSGSEVGVNVVRVAVVFFV